MGKKPTGILWILPPFQWEIWSIFLQFKIHLSHTVCRKLKYKLISCQVLWKGNQFLLHMLHPSCCSCYKPGAKSRMRKGPDCDYYKRNIFIVICDRNSVTYRRSGISALLVHWLTSYFSLDFLDCTSGIIQEINPDVANMLPAYINASS